MIAVLLGANQALAEPSGRALELRWRAPESCASEAAIVRKVQQQLGHSLTLAPRAIVAMAQVSQGKDGHFRAELETVVQGEGRVRVLEGA